MFLRTTHIIREMTVLEVNRTGSNCLRNKSARKKVQVARKHIALEMKDEETVAAVEVQDISRVGAHGWLYLTQTPD